MDYLKYVQEQFHHDGDAEICEQMKRVVVKFSVLASDLPGFDTIRAVMTSFPDRDKVDIFLLSESENSFSIQSGSMKTDEDYTGFLDYLDANEKVSVILEITKTIDQNQFSVYCFEKFCEDLNNLQISEVMMGFAHLLSGNDHLFFQVFNKDIFLQTETMVFSSSERTINWKLEKRAQRLNQCRTVSGFADQNIYSVIPEDFHIHVDDPSRLLTVLFGRICTALSLAYLATTSSITAEELRIQIAGQGNVEYMFQLDQVAQNENLYKIYRWIFTDGNPIDKALLARNSISAHCRYTQIDQLDGKTLASIQSNYGLYLKDNVVKYIELTNAMAGFIKEATSGVGDCISQLLNHLKTNLIAMLSFLFTVALANAVSDQPLDNIFTEDITWIMYLVLVGSLIYFAMSVIEVRYAQRKLCEQYNDLVNHYRGILSEEEINHITGNGKMLEKAKKSLAKGMLIWSVVWICMLLAAFIMIDCIGKGPHLLRTIFTAVKNWFVSLGQATP